MTIEKQKSALYIRVSTNMQVDKDSLPLQKNDLINYSKYALNVDDYEVFEDAGYSAKNTDRPRYQQMMARIRTGEFSHLVVWKIDRISRNLIDFATMYEELKQLGVVFVSKNEQFDTSSAMGEAMLKIILVFAELERKMTSERVTAVMLSRANNGQWNGGHIPFGYDYDKKTKTISVNESEAETVKLIYDLYEKMRSQLKVSFYLNENGIKTKAGNVWSPVSVNKILSSPFYVGGYLYNQHDTSKSRSHSQSNRKDESEWILIKNHHEAIISEEQYAKACEIRKSQRRGNGDGPRYYTRVNTHIFAGLLECGACGSQMVSTVDRKRNDGYRPSVYLCSRHRRFNDCPNKYISDIVIGPFVLNYIANIIKAQNNFGESTSIQMFEKKLLRGDMFKEVSGIESTGLREMYDMLRSGKFQKDLYEPKRFIEVNTEEKERELLMVEKRKKERALARLKTLYLYNDDTISEKDYLIERKQITDELERIDKRLNELERDALTSFTVSDDEFMQKATYFIMSQQLTSKRFIDFVSIVRNIDTTMVKDFINSVIKKIVIDDGKITSILFKNGIEHKFMYLPQN